MNKFLWLFLFLYLYFFIKRIYNWLNKKRTLEYLIDKFKNVVKTLDSSQFTLSDTEARKIILNELFNENPRISSLLTYVYFDYSFSLLDGPEETLSKFQHQYNALMQKYDKVMFERLSIFNPVNPLKDIFLLPSKILSWFGINLNDVPARSFSLSMYIFGWIFSKYGKNIFDWILSLFS